MSFRDFLDASYALLAEEHQRINPLKDLLSVSQEIQPRPAERPVVKTTVVQNQASMAALEGMLAAVPNAPTKRKPRRTR